MTKKIFRWVFAVALVLLISSFIIIMVVTNNYSQILQQSQLQKSLSIAATGVEISGEKYLNQLKDGTMRFTWVDPKGNVKYDSDNNAAEMENHINREEIEEAEQQGYGESYRYSSTLTEKTMYYAVKLSDNTILRVSVNQDTVLKALINLIRPILLLFLIGLILSILAAKKISQKIVMPLNQIDLERPLENDSYDELAPLLSHIEHQRNQIKEQLMQLDERKKEFYSVIKNMNEGLILLNPANQILSINNAAAVYLDTDSSCVGKNFLEIERDPEATNAIKKAKDEGHSTVQIQREGKVFLINISRIDENKRSAGLAVLIFEITDKVFAEKNRREFTANVSHELKTPLHSIMASAELMENGLVKEEDIPDFIGRIKDEASRLVTLIEDILKLSQLDENRELSLEDVDLYAMGQSNIAMLNPYAREKNVKLLIEGERSVISAVPQLIQEIIYNLVQNGIKYNKPNGKVFISVKDSPCPTLIVEDTGIGIPKEHQNRVFERFYRVDKSRSKDTGGTGLGLSIVKHSVNYLGGEIKLDSSEKGTRITVTFPNKKAPQ